jgi:Uma2 family endonuclease
MSTLGKRYESVLTLDVFLESEFYLGDDRYEFDENGVYLMSPANDVHERVIMSLGSLFVNALKGSHCRVYGSNLGIYMFDSGKFYLPDISVICNEAKIVNGKCLSGPDVVIEVLSEGSKKRDWFIKNKAYKEFGVGEYWIVDYDIQAVFVENFKTGDRKWFRTGDLAESRELNIRVSVADIFE